MPMLVDPDGIFVRRVDFNGHYEVTLSPRNDRRTEIKHGSEDVDWDLWHKDWVYYVIITLLFQDLSLRDDFKIFHYVMILGLYPDELFLQKIRHL